MPVVESSNNRNCYGLECTVCGNSYHQRSKWLEHLFQSFHQTKARSEVIKWDDKVKQCVFLVFSSTAVSDGTILSEDTCNNQLYKLLEEMTDFVWRPERPKLWVVQFESRKKVKEIQSSLKSFKNDQSIHFVKATDVPDVQWKALIPEEFSSNSSHIPEKIPTEEPEMPPVILPASTPSVPRSSTSWLPKCQNVNTQQAVKELEKLALKLKMGRPVFRKIKLPKTKLIGRRFEFVVHLNDKTFRAPSGKTVHTTRKTAKWKAALYCTQVLKEIMDKSVHIRNQNQ